MEYNLYYNNKKYNINIYCPFRNKNKNDEIGQ